VPETFLFGLDFISLNSQTPYLAACFELQLNDKSASNDLENGTYAVIPQIEQIAVLFIKTKTLWLDLSI
jgi:hypothetical protein